MLVKGSRFKMHFFDWVTYPSTKTGKRTLTSVNKLRKSHCWHEQHTYITLFCHAVNRTMHLKVQHKYD
jgi:hypothetical protein